MFVPKIINSTALFAQSIVTYIGVLKEIVLIILLKLLYFYGAHF